jgi:hypothetical protein
MGNLVDNDRRAGKGSCLMRCDRLYSALCVVSLESRRGNGGEGAKEVDGQLSLFNGEPKGRAQP